jgi:hypothetical protein
MLMLMRVIPIYTILVASGKLADIATRLAKERYSERFSLSTKRIEEVVRRVSSF